MSTVEEWQQQNKAKQDRICEQVAEEVRLKTNLSNMSIREDHLIKIEMPEAHEVTSEEEETNATVGTSDSSDSD